MRVVLGGGEGSFCLVSTKHTQTRVYPLPFTHTPVPKFLAHTDTHTLSLSLSHTHTHNPLFSQKQQAVQLPSASPLVAVGLWTDMSVRLLALPSLEPLATAALGGIRR